MNARKDFSFILIYEIDDNNLGSAGCCFISQPSINNLEKTDLRTSAEK